MVSSERDRLWEEMNERFHRLFHLSAEEVEAVFRRRAEELAARPEEAARDGRVYLVCAAGGERYAMPIAHVDRVVAAERTVPIPGSAAGRLSVMNHQNAIVPIVTLERALDRPPAPEPHRTAVVLVHDRATLACAVERVVEIRSLRDDQLGTLAQRHPVLHQVGRADDGVIGVLDVPALFQAVLNPTREETHAH
jgi:chemotaxis signal transduction protein